MKGRIAGLSFTLALLAGCGGSGPVATPSAHTTLQWIGHATFLLTTSSGTKILIDPMYPRGYDLPTFTDIDAVTISHEHGDHNNVALAGEDATVIRGLMGDDWTEVEQQVKEVSIRTVGTYHDDTQGSMRGKNAVFIFRADGMSIVHLGDLGHKLTSEQAKAIDKADMLLIPVGGHYTIDGATAKEVAHQLSATILIPMHYKTPKLRPDWPGENADSFIEGMAYVERPDTNTFAFTRKTLPSVATVVVLN